MEFQGIELDIVIPDTKTLEIDQKKTLLICIPKSSDTKIIEEKISQFEKIQTVKENIWLGLSENVPMEKNLLFYLKKTVRFQKSSLKLLNSVMLEE